jgi:hypothetical protein
LGKIMSENEKDVPIKEQEDGSILAKIELPEEIEVESDGKEGKKKKKDKKAEKEEHHDEEVALEVQVDDDSAEENSETDEERQAIREARREERRLKKDLKRQREISAKNKITTLERRNAELAERLAKVESTAVSYQFAQIDKAIEDEATKVEYAKMKMLQAAQANDAAAQVDFLEQLTEAKQRLNQAQHYKKQQLEAAKAPKQNVPNPVTTEVQENATRWLKKNSWYDPQARDTDSRIAKVVDQELASDGWDPADPEYWSELDSRLATRLPHRYASKGGSNQRRSAGPTASSRTSNPSGNKPGTITLSRDRVQAIKDAGAWDDPERRNKMIRAYAQYDRQNKG